MIELNRPERRNALHDDMYDAIPLLIERFEHDDEVGCMLVTAAGGTFCAGGDVQAGVDRSRSGRPGGTEDGSDDNPLERMARMVVMLHESSKISIAALPGPAVGAGIGIALATDLRVATPKASLIPGWGTLGFSGDFGGTWFLSRMLGPARALAMLVDNETYDASRCQELGLYNRIVDSDRLRAEALAWGAAIAAGSRQAFGFMKRNVQDAQEMSLRSALPGESARMRASGQTEEHRAAVRRWLAAAEAKRAAAP